MSTKRKFIVPTPEEDARINAGIASDPDTMEWTKQDFAEAAQIKRARGRPAGSVADVRKEQVTMRLDPDVLEALRASGPGWQSRVNDILRKAVRPHAAKESR